MAALSQQLFFELIRQSKSSLFWMSKRSQWHHSCGISVPLCALKKTNKKAQIEVAASGKWNINTKKQKLKIQSSESAVI
jgi:hypothetical protein